MTPRAAPTRAREVPVATSAPVAATATRTTAEPTVPRSEDSGTATMAPMIPPESRNAVAVVSRTGLPRERRPRRPPTSSDRPTPIRSRWTEPSSADFDDADFEVEAFFLVPDVDSGPRCQRRSAATATQSVGTKNAPRPARSVITDWQAEPNGPAKSVSRASAVKTPTETSAIATASAACPPSCSVQARRTLEWGERA